LTEPLASKICEISNESFLRELTKGYQRKYGIAIDLSGAGPITDARTVSVNAVATRGACNIQANGQPAAVHTLFNPVAWDALVAIVHPHNPITNLSLRQLRKIYAGHVTNWRQLGGNDQPLELQVRRGKQAGVELTLREMVFQDPQRDFIAAAVHPTAEPLENAVETNAYALAVTAISNARKRDVKILSLDNKTASYDSIRSGAYRLYRPLYIAYEPDNPQRAEVERFIAYVHSGEGRAIIRIQGVVPYLDALNLVGRRHERRRAGRGS
jgi:phosphate transport system substrate-binding protein